MSPQQLLQELETAEGPCLNLCAYCPEQGSLKEIYETVKQIIDENERLQKEVESLRDVVKHYVCLQ